VALASPSAPLTLSLKAISTTSIPILASSAVLAQKFAPARLSSPANNQQERLTLLTKRIQKLLPDVIKHGSSFFSFFSSALSNIIITFAPLTKSSIHTFSINFFYHGY
jgi:hypothetical protein